MARIGPQIRRWLTPLLFGAVVVLLLPAATHAQIPHAYPGGSMYMEGYFLPPVTASPADPDWTPDGDSLSFAYQGFIWTVPVQGGVAHQLTSGPGYHSQPAWSPTGRYLAYTADRDKNLDIWVLDTETGKRRRLTENEYIDVLPRWSPDGERVLFTSNRAGSFDLWAVPLETGELRPVLQDSLHNDFAGDWIPSGELIFVSNRSGFGTAPHGSGSLFRADRDGGNVRPIQYEETNWHTLPVVGPGGSEVAYISDRSGDNELVLLPADGGSSYRVTRTVAGEYFPSWSPSGRRLAYVTDSSGTFGLRTIDRHGGAGTPVTVTDYDWQKDVGTLKVRIVDPGGRTAARVYLTDSDGRAFFPDASYPSVSSITEEYYFQSDGEFEVRLPAGRVQLRILKGFEFEPVERSVSVEAGSTREVTLRLDRMADLNSRGWYAGDNHTHMNYGGHFRVTPSEMVHRMRAEDLSVVNDLLANKYTRLLNLEHFSGRPDGAGTDRRILYFNQEFRPSWAGHISLLGLDSLLYPFMLGYERTPLFENYPSNASMLRRTHEQGGWGGYVHPYLSDRDPSAENYGGARTLPVDAALGLVDYLEVACVWSNERTTSEVWYRLLNSGVRIPASAGSDAMPNIWRRPSIGATRVYVNLPEGRELTYNNWMQALMEGRSFVTSGPLLRFSVNGRQIGEEIEVESGTTLRVQASAQSIFRMDSLQIVRNGDVIAGVGIDGGHQADIDVRVSVEESGWLAARAVGPKQPGLMDTNLFAHTSPIYVRVGDQPIRSSKSAGYFVKWIDTIEDMVRSDSSRYTPAVRREILDTFRKARELYRDRSSQR